MLHELAVTASEPTIHSVLVAHLLWLYLIFTRSLRNMSDGAEMCVTYLRGMWWFD